MSYTRIDNFKDFYPLADSHEPLNFYGCEFSYTDFTPYNLTGAIFKECKFFHCNFTNTIANGADFSSSIFTCCKLQGASFITSILRGTYFYNVDISYGDFTYADLTGCNLENCTTIATKDTQIKRNTFTRGFLLVCPEEGLFTAFKRAGKYIIKLEIPSDARRTSGFSRKCRCDKAKVVQIEDLEGHITSIQKLPSDYDENFVYVVGEIVEVSDFSPNRWEECAKGIYFYMTREEARYC